MGSDRPSRTQFCRTVGGDGCELTVTVEPEKAPKPETAFERIAGGDGCELTVCRPACYPTNEDLPETIRSALPEALQTVYRDAFESTLKYLGTADTSLLVVNPDQAADQAGWSAVRRLYEQKGATWLRRSLD